MKKYFIVSLLVVLSLVLTGMADAASTIGTNMSTTGTFAQTVSSATAALFQNAAGTLTVLQVDTNTGTGRVGVGGAPGTTFEVQGTSSASYFYTQNTIQVAGAGASVAYNRFGTAATTHSLAATNDVLINGILEVDGKSFFDGTASVASHFEVGGTASVSGVVYLTDGEFRPGTGGDAATAFRFQNAAGTLTVLQVDTNTGTGRVGVGGAPGTTFEVQGTSSASYFYTQNTIQVAGAGATVAYSRFGTGTTNTPGEINAANDLLITGALEVDGKASVAGNFQTSGRVIADTLASHSFKGDLILTSNLIVGGTTTSQSSGLYTAEFGGGAGTASVSILFGSSTVSSKGTCFQMKNSAGEWVYARVAGTTWTVNYIRCE